MPKSHNERKCPSFFKKGQDPTLPCMTGPDQGLLCLPPKHLSTPSLPLMPIPYLTQGLLPSSLAEWPLTGCQSYPRTLFLEVLSGTHIPSIFYLKLFRGF